MRAVNLLPRDEVTTKQRILAHDRHILTRWADWMESLRNEYSMPAMSVLGTVGCVAFLLWQPLSLSTEGVSIDFEASFHDRVEQYSRLLERADAPAAPPGTVADASLLWHRTTAAIEVEQVMVLGEGRPFVSALARALRFPFRPGAAEAEEREVAED